jgi:hypothetical protein
MPAGITLPAATVNDRYSPSWFAAALAGGTALPAAEFPE